MQDDLMTPEEADDVIRSALPRWEAESLALPLAVGGILRETIAAERDQPPFDRVTMDGIAIVAAAAGAGRREFAIEGVQPAGVPPRALQSADACIEVMTGAVLPGGTDCVVPFEQIQVTDGRAHLRQGASLDAGSNIHRSASDARAGDVLLPTGHRLQAADIAVAASAGFARLSISRAPRIMVISTGNELIEPGEPIEPWQIRRSNAYAVLAALNRNGWTQNSQDHLADDPDVLRTRLAAHLDTHDVLVLSGGVSKGRSDHVPAALASLGVTVLVQGVAQRPGRPFWFGLARSGKPVFALPGNPVSTLACLARFVLPAFGIASGAPQWQPMSVSLGRRFQSGTTLTSLIPCALEIGADAVCRATPEQTSTSGDLVSLRATHGFVTLPPGPAEFAAGTIVSFYPC